MLNKLQDLCESNLVSQIISSPPVIQELLLNTTVDKISRECFEDCDIKVNTLYFDLIPKILGNIIKCSTDQHVYRHNFHELYKDKCDKDILQNIIDTCDLLFSQIEDYITDIHSSSTQEEEEGDY